MIIFDEFHVSIKNVLMNVRIFCLSGIPVSDIVRPMNVVNGEVLILRAHLGCCLWQCAFIHCFWVCSRVALTSDDL
jgi:hypothetical protein